jgi:hypothetical protein
MSDKHDCGEVGEGSSRLLKPMDIKRRARVPYGTVIRWLTTGHPRAGLLPSIDLAETGKCHSFRVRPEDWESFLLRLRTQPRARPQPTPQPRPANVRATGGGMFRY